MAVKYSYVNQGRAISVGTGVPTHSAVAGDEYTDLTSGIKYQYTTAWGAGSLNGSNKGYIKGFNLAYNSVSTIDITAGECSDFAGTMSMVYGSTLTINLAASGANGLDTGAEASSTWYYAFVIYNPDTTTYASLCSVSATPTLPSGYTKYRAVGCFRNNGSSNIIKMYWDGLGNTRTVNYDDSILNVVNGSTATTFTSMDLTATLSPLSKSAILNVICVCDVLTNNQQTYVSATSTSTNGSGYVTTGDSQAGCQIVCPAPSRTAYHKTTANGNTYINVDGYVEQV